MNRFHDNIFFLSLLSGSRVAWTFLYNPSKNKRLDRADGELFELCLFFAIIQE